MYVSTSQRQGFQPVRKQPQLPNGGSCAATTLGDVKCNLSKRYIHDLCTVVYVIHLKTIHIVYNTNIIYIYYIIYIYVYTYIIYTHNTIYIYIHTQYNTYIYILLFIHIYNIHHIRIFTYIYIYTKYQCGWDMCIYLSIYKYTYKFKVTHTHTDTHHLYICKSCRLCLQMSCSACHHQSRPAMPRVAGYRGPPW